MSWKIKMKGKNSKNFCPACEVQVSSEDEAISCDICHCWVHIRCDKISPHEYQMLITQEHQDFEWTCGLCARGYFGCDIASPPRTPLQVVNGPNIRNVLNQSPTSNLNQSPSARSSINLSGSGSKTPAEDRLRKKILRKNEKGETQLHLAAIRGSGKVAEKLLQTGIIDPNVTDNAGWTPLHEACNRGLLSVARVLVKYGADVNMSGGTKEQREPPLHDAARNGHFQVVKFLAKNGAHLTAKKENGRTPLDEAKASKSQNPGLTDVIQFLTEHQENQGNLSPLVISTPEESESEGEESKDADIARFLGISNSPGVEQALFKLGITQSNETSSRTETVGNNPNKNAKVVDNSPRTNLSLKIKRRSLNNSEKKKKRKKSDKHSGSTFPQDSPASRRRRRSSSSQRRSSSESSRARQSLSMEDKPESTTPTAKAILAAPASNSGSSSNTATLSTAPASGNIKASGSDKDPATTSSQAFSKPEKTSSETSSLATSEAKISQQQEKQPQQEKPGKDLKEQTSSISTTTTATSGEKRSSAELDSHQEEEAAKRRKTTSLSNKKSEENGKEKLSGIRSTRGNSSEKTSSTTSDKNLAASGGPNNPGGLKTSRNNSLDRKSPSVSQSNSAANSPARNKEKSPDLNNEEADNQNTGRPKVPPLKISLSGGNGNPSPPNSGSGTSCGGTSIGADQQKLATEKKNSGYEQNVLSSQQDSKEEKQQEESSGAKQQGDEKEIAKTGNETESEKAAAAAAAASRITRSRATVQSSNPNDSMEQPGNTSEASSTNTMDNSSSNEQQLPRGSETSNRSANYTEYHVKKRKLRSQVDDNQPGTSNGNNGKNGGNNGANGGNGATANSGGAVLTGNEPLNDIQKFLNLRKTVEGRRKNLFPVQPKPPQGFKDYLMNKKTYLLQSNSHERLRSMPMIQPPPSLEGPLRQLFVEQEKDRYQLRIRHLVEKEKLVLNVEQEIIRVHGRAARALANQPYPYSVCTILKDEEIYTPIDTNLDEKTRDIRSRYNGRLFLSWLQDVDDKWEKIKEQMVLRHHNEAESLNAVQKMDWEWKLQEISGSSNSANNNANSNANKNYAGANASDNLSQKVDDLYIPMVHVSDDFDLSDNR